MDSLVSAGYFEAQPASDTKASYTPDLSLDGFEGSLEFLLRVARAHQVNLSSLSILEIVNQLAEALEHAPVKTTVGQKADWVVMASWIVLLRTNLLLPVDTADQQKAEIDAEELRKRLLALEEAKTLAAWLDRRPVLGRDVFARGWEEFPEGFGEVGHLQVDVIEFLWAVMELFDDPADKLSTVEVYRPAGGNAYSVHEARLRILRMLGDVGTPQTLDQLLPDDVRNTQNVVKKIEVRRLRAAMCSTFIASLELAKLGNLAMEQEEFLAPISLKALI